MYEYMYTVQYVCTSICTVCLYSEYCYVNATLCRVNFLIFTQNNLDFLVQIIIKNIYLSKLFEKAS